jgi:hypothetical protein
MRERFLYARRAFRFCQAPDNHLLGFLIMRNPPASDYPPLFVPMLFPQCLYVAAMAEMRTPVCSTPTQDWPERCGDSVPQLNSQAPSQSEAHECNTLERKPAITKLLER